MKVEVKSRLDGHVMSYPDGGPDTAARTRLIRVLSTELGGSLVYRPMAAIPGLVLFPPWGAEDDKALAAAKVARGEASAEFEASSEILAKIPEARKKASDVK